MKTLHYIIYSLCILAIFSCKKDSIVSTVNTTLLNETIAGTVTIDTDFDEKGNFYFKPSDGTVRVYCGEIDLINDILGEKPDTLDAPYNEILWADVDSLGQYIIEGVPPLANQQLVLYSPISVSAIFAKDYTPDGDEFEEVIGSYISISIDMEEYDDGNDFIVQLQIGISGFIVEDTDNDSLGDTAIPGQTVGLYKRDENGYPIGPLLRIATSNSDGLYEIGTVSEGEYVIKFNEFNYIAFFSSDYSPEINEPSSNPENYLIQVDITDPNVIDTDNFIETIKNISCSGFVLQDLDDDGIGDVGVEGLLIQFYERGTDGFPNSQVLTSTFTDENGYYELNRFPEGNYVIEFIGNGSFQVTNSSDEEPEAWEISTSPDPIYVAVDILDNYHVDGMNNYVIIEYTPVISISGFTLLDIDNDTIGDEGVKALRLELYQRNEDGVPMGNLIKEAYSDEDGYFEFRNIPAGEYVIYYIGDPFHFVIKSEDESPEMGEPDIDAGIIFIQVDLLSDEAEDSDNNYTLKTN